MCSENGRESMDVLLYTSTVKNKGLIGNILGCEVLFCGVWHMFKNMFLYFFNCVYKKNELSGIYIQLPLAILWEQMHSEWKC